MKFHVLHVSSVSACFELESTSPYYSESAFDVRLNGKDALKGINTNVFSVFDLTPNTEYSVSVGEFTLNIHTLTESTCIDVRLLGAVGDGVTDDTVAIQSAISICPKNGRVTVPAGTYLIRPITLKSGITLELKEGAVLLGDTCEEHYPLLPGEITENDGKDVTISSWEGTPCECRQPLVSAYFAENITVVGRGVIDGNAQNSTWWNDVKARRIGRPRLVFLNRCENVVFHGITGKNSASWNFHPYFSKNVSFLDTAVEAPPKSPNTDGTDPESCDTVNYIGMRFSVGDDAIAIKSGKMYMGMKYKTPASRHTVRNCLMEHAHGAVVLGSEMSGGVKELSVTQCYFKHTDRGLRIKTRRKRGKYAVIDGVEFSNIIMDNVKAPLVINMFYYCDPDGHDEIVWSKDKHPVDDTTPYLGAFTFRDIKCTDCEWAAGFFYGLPEQPIGSVTLENIDFSFKEDASHGYPALMDFVDPMSKHGLYFNGVNKVFLHNVKMAGQDGERVTVENVSSIEEVN